MSQPIQSPAPSPSPTPKPPRRVPPPCWTHDETLALIESYHEKWYILRRGNLKAVHWQEVADSVARRCRFTIPTKTSIQCRHKIEKLRKRYRTEKQRLSSLPNNNKFSSSWVFFKKMDNMEKGPLSTTAEAAPAVKVKDEDGRDEGEEDEDEDDDENENEEENEDEDYNNTPHHQQTNFHRSVSNGSGSGSGTGTGTGFRFRIPSGARTAPPIMTPGVSRPKNYEYYKPSHNPNLVHSSRFMSGGSVPVSGKGSESGVKRGKKEMDAVGEMVSSIRMLGEGFVKMEQMKMEMAKEMEQMRMEMEMKRTEMILESQQKIVEAFAQGICENKKLKRMPSPEQKMVEKE